jgi:dolichol-phosphate mannosyltransferase
MEGIPAGKKMTKLSILMPVRNEAENLKVILKILEAVVEEPHEILVVYDTPDDTSIPVIKKFHSDISHIRGVHNTLGRGIINAIKAGVAAAKGKYVVIITADDIGPVLGIKDMLALMDQGCDLVSATRYAHGGKVLGGAFGSRMLSPIANKLFKLVSGSALTDSTVGIKMFRRTLLDDIHLVARPVGWAVAFELAMKAQLSGYKLGEVPIVSINRFYSGKSSFKFGPWINEYTRWFIWGSTRLLKSGKRGARVLVRVPRKVH